MEEIIGDLEKELGNIIQGKPVKPIRRELDDMVDIRALRMLVYSLEWTSAGYQTALRISGKKIGKRIGRNSDKLELSLALKEVKKIIEALGIGKAEIQILPKLDGALFRIYESALTAEVSKTSQRFCFFEEGFIEGYLEGVISKKGFLVLAKEEVGVTEINVEEKKCVGLGDNFCEFLIKF